MERSTYSDADLRGCLKWTLNFMKVVGYWFPRSGNRRHTLLYAVYSTSAITFTLLTLMCVGIAHLISVFGQIEEMIDNLFIYLTLTCQCLKVLTFIINREKIYGLLDCMEENIFKPRSEQQFKKAMTTVNNTNRIAKGLMSLVIGTAVMWSLAAMLESYKTKQLPIKGRFPFNVDKSPKYEVVFMYQMSTLMLCGCINAAMDMVAAAFISQICIQLDILSDSILHVKEFAELHVAEAQSVHDLRISSKLESEMTVGLIECVQHHLKIMT